MARSHALTHIDWCVRPDGSVAATFGGPGADPGEMGTISYMNLRGDTLHVLDGTFRRIVHFTADGAALPRRATSRI